MPPVTVPWAQINGTLPPLIPDPAQQAPPPVFADPLPQDEGTAPLSAIPQAQPRSAVWAPVDAGKPVPRAAMGAISVNADPLGAAEQHHATQLGRDYAKDADPYGSPDNHPGFWGKVAHGLSVATGGPGRRKFEEMGLEKSLRELMGEQSKENLEGAQAGEQTAEAGKNNAETAEVAPNAASTRAVQGAEAARDTAAASEAPSEIKKNEAEIYGLENPWAKLPENQPLQNADDLNKSLADRYQVLHPGQPLPQEYALPPNATKGDFERIDKMLTGQETAEGTAQNHADSERLREATLALAQQNAGEKNLWSVPQPDGTTKLVQLKPGDTIPKGAVSATQQGAQNAKAGGADVQASLTYANDYLSSKAYTGPGDEALQDQFFNLAKPSTGFRMNQAQIDQLHNMASWMDSWRGKLYHLQNGVWFAPRQREQIVETMNALAQSKGIQPGGSAGAPKDGTTKTNSSGDKIVFRGGKWGPG